MKATACIPEMLGVSHAPSPLGTACMLQSTHVYHDIRQLLHRVDVTTTR